MPRIPLLAAAALTLALAAPAPQAQVVINEIMYHGEGIPEVEYVELFNAGDVGVDLTGWTLLDDDDAHTPCPLDGSLPAGGYLVLTNFVARFQAAYPGSVPLNPTSCDDEAPGVGFGLGNGGDEVRLFDATGELVDRVVYLDQSPWPPEADGNGPSLELIHPSLDNNDPLNWRSSHPARPPGTPGERNSAFVADLPPAIDRVRRDVALPRSDDTVTVSARLRDDGAIAAAELMLDTGSGFAAVPLLDDGVHGDGDAGDGIHGATVPPRETGSLVRYWILARDDAGQESRFPAGAPDAYLAYTVDHTLPALRINELLAVNDATLADGAGDYDDWVELRNPGPHPVDLQGMFLGNDIETSVAWPLPGVVLAPGARLLIWCDAEPLEGPFHAAFRLPRGGGEVALFDTVNHGNQVIDHVTYGPQSADVSFGLLPEDADAPEYLTPATPASSNTAASWFSPVCINEFLAASQLAVPDFVELYNRGDAPVDIGGWGLSDRVADPARYTVPAGTVLAPGEFLALDSSQLGFGLDAGGDETLVLLHADGLTGQDWFDYGPQLPDISQGRLADGTPNWRYFSAWTLQSANACDAGAPGPGEVTGLTWPARGALTWVAVDRATAYDVVRGELALLRATGDTAQTVPVCVENNSRDLWGWAPSVPLPGGGWYYLVRASDSGCGLGTYAGPGTTAGSRDPGLLSVCP